MIGFDYLGKAGQLGNQMFQFAGTKGIAQNRGYDMCIPDHNEKVNDGIGNILRIELDDAFDIECQRSTTGSDILKEQRFDFDETLFNNCPDNVSLYGFLSVREVLSKILKTLSVETLYSRREFEMNVKKL